MQRKILGFLVAFVCLITLPDLAVFATQRSSMPQQTQDAPSLDGVPQLVMPVVDNAKQLANYHTAPKDEPLRFAVPLETKTTTDSAGVWDILPGDIARWRLRVLSKDALSLNFGFTRYQMPPGGQLTVSDLRGTQLVGPYTAADNELHGQLWTPLVLGDEALIEVRVPVAARDQLELTLTSVNHGFLDPFNPPEKSGSCNVDVACAQADPWRPQVASVVGYSSGGSIFCTGALINNTANDRRPYILTADHCSVDAALAPSIVTYWNYANTTCRVPGSVESGLPGNGPLTQTLTGAIFRADYAASDMTLIELDDPIPPAYNPYWAGWDRSGNNATRAIGIHHPRGDEKRISFEDQATTITSYGGTTVPGAGTHVRVIDWDLGTTEPGSSGSPLFDQNGRIIGQLHGGGAACGNDLSDYYGRIFVSWTGGGANNTRLSNWLDPASTGATTLNGISSSGFTLSADPLAANVCSTAGSTSTSITLTRASAGGAVTLAATNLPVGATASFNPNPLTGAATSSTLMISNLAAVAAGNYPITVTGTEASNTAQTSFALTVATAPPTAPTLTSPANGATDVGSRPTFTWQAVAQASSYLVEVATDAAFSTIVTSGTVSNTSFTPSIDLDSNTTYYWRVRVTNGCGSVASTRSFTTSVLPGFCAVGTIPQLALNEDFSAGVGAWTSSGTGDTWALSTAQSSPDSGGNAFRAIGSAAVSDQRLISPPVAIPPVSTASNATLQFQNFQVIEQRPSGGCYDGALIEVSTDDGATWTQIANERLLTDPYDGTIASTVNNPLSGSQAWCGDPQDWLNSVVDVSAYAGQTVRFRFRLGTDASLGREGWYIDDVKVQSCRPGTAPAFTSALPAPVRASASYSHTFTATGDPAPSFAITSGTLPSWLALNATTGVLSGTPPGPGTFGPFTIAASNGVSPAATQSFSIVLGAAPAFTSAPPSAILAGAPFSHTFVASGTPAPSFAITSGALPSWLALNATSGVLSGTPPGPGTFGPFTISARNGFTPNATRTFSIVVNQNDNPQYIYLPLVGR